MNRTLRLIGCAAYCAAACVYSPGKVLAQDRPNIVLFVVDDMGWQDTSLELHSSRTVWNDLYNTPNMQRLADSGMRFTDAYAASPVCSPTRASLMTGRNPARSDVTSWIGHGQPSNQYLNSPVWSSSGLQPNDGNQTLPSILQANGYRTAHIGKAHFGASGTPGANPLNLGFDINVGGSHIGGPFSYFSPWVQNPALYPNMQHHPAGTYITDALTEDANQIIDQAVVDNVPFFINMAHYAVHAPIGGQGDPDYLASYQSANRPNPEDDYASMLESMDASLGSILDNLEAEGIADNTMVVFVSDNGGLSNHTRNFGGVQTVQTLGGDSLAVNFQRDHHNGPIRSGKGSGYEGGIRIPMIVAWAGQQTGQPVVNGSLPISPGSISSEPVISDDVFTTLLHVAGIDNIAQYTEDGSGTRIVDGVDLSPILNGSGTFDRGGSIYFHYPHQWYQNVGVGEGIEPFSAVRNGDFKLIYFYGDGVADGAGYDPHLELYNLADDIGEQNSLSLETNAPLVRQLTNDLVGYLLMVDAPIPIVRATGQPAALPALITDGLGDLTGDGQVTLADWLLFRSRLGTTIVAASAMEAEMFGDFDFNLQIDRSDFLIFKLAYNNANGPGALAHAMSVPEPSTFAILLVVGGVMGAATRTPFLQFAFPTFG